MNDDPSLSESKLASIIESYCDPYLTPEELEALLTQDDHGIQPVAMRAFEDVEAFRAGSNNYFLAFTATVGSIEQSLLRRAKSFQRLGALYPDLVDMLTQTSQGLSRHEIDESGWTGLYEAYCAHSQLVDINDPGIVKYGTDEYYLCR